ncbi:MAG TPA: sensor histidine kinase [Jiangellaceae bacterium]
MDERGTNRPRFSARLVDALIVGVLVIGGVVSLFTYPELDDLEYLEGDALGVVLAIGCAAPLWFRRRAPMATGLAVAAFVVPFLVWNYSVPTASVAMLIAVYSAGAYATLARSAVVLAALMSVSVGYVLISSDRAPGDGAYAISNVVISALAFLLVWGLGRAVRSRRAYTAELEDRAKRLERTSAAEVRAARAEERSRIARELHDVVAHHVSVMTVQAAGAQRTLDRDPQRSAEALRSIEATGRSALSEMRRIVGVLRGPDSDGADGAAADLAPAPGLSDLDALAAKLRATGLPVDVRIEGERSALPVGVDLTAFRIVQEALTNTIKHAGPSRANVVIRYRPGELEVGVSDDGRGLAAALEGRPTGHGLLGMRERVALYGGTLAVGPRPGGGFDVRARIPYDPPAV